MNQIKKIKNLLQSSQIRQFNTLQFSQEDKQKAKSKSKQKYAHLSNNYQKTQKKKSFSMINQQNYQNSNIQNQEKEQRFNYKNQIVSHSAIPVISNQNNNSNLDDKQKQKLKDKNKNLVNIRRSQHHSNFTHLNNQKQRFNHRKKYEQDPIRVQNIDTFQDQQKSQGQQIDYNIRLNINHFNSQRKSSLKNSKNSNYQFNTDRFEDKINILKVKQNKNEYQIENEQKEQNNQIHNIQYNDFYDQNNNQQAYRHSFGSKNYKNRQQQQQQLPLLRFLKIQQQKLNQQKKRSSKLQLQLSQIQSQYGDYDSSSELISKQSHKVYIQDHNYHNIKPFSFQNTQKQVKFMHLQSEMSQDSSNFQQNLYLQSLKCLFKEVIDLSSIAQVIKYHLKHKGLEIIQVLVQSLQSGAGSALSSSFNTQTKNKSNSNRFKNSPQRKGPIIKRENFEYQSSNNYFKLYSFKQIKAQQFNKMLQSFMLGYKKSSLSNIAKRIFGDRPKININQFNDKNSPFMSTLSEKDLEFLCSQSITKIKNTRVSDLLKKLFSAWIQISYYQDKIKQTLKGNTQKLQQFLDEITQQSKEKELVHKKLGLNKKVENQTNYPQVCQKNISSVKFHHFMSLIGQEQNYANIKNKQFRLRIEVYLYSILKQNFKEQNFIKWIFNQ